MTDKERSEKEKRCDQNEYRITVLETAFGSSSKLQWLILAVVLGNLLKTMFGA